MAPGAVAEAHRPAEAVSDRPDAVTAVPPARTIARLLTSERDCKSAEALRVRVAIETASPRILAARNLLDRFRTMVAAKGVDDLTPWLREAIDTELASFASCVRDDEAVGRAAIVEPWSNGQTAYSDEAGRVFRFQAGHQSDVKPATVPI